MSPRISANPPRRARRVVAVALCALLAPLLAPLLTSGPAVAAGPVGYVRLAHLSPDTPDVDVYLSAVSGGAAQRFPGVGYGTVSTYLSVPVGTYAVAMRAAGAPATDPPVLTTNVTVDQGKAYTVAGVGKHADLGLKVIDDDLTLPPAGQAKVRVIQASLRAPSLTVAISGGSVIADNIAFATTTDYLDVTPGHWTLKAQGTGGSPSSTLTATLAQGNVYSLIVLDAKNGNGLTAQLRSDAQRTGTVPTGGVATGAGGTARRWPILPIAVAGVLLVAGATLLLTRRRPARV